MAWSLSKKGRAREALVRKYGGEEGYLEEMRRRGRNGGKLGGGKGGFTTMNKLDHLHASSKGGSSKRSKK
jgi:hypothetical protein